MSQKITRQGPESTPTERTKTATELERAVSLLRATLDATADGILVVDTEGKMVSFNRKFVDMWRIPESIVASQSDDQALAYVLNQLTHPDAFLCKVRELYAQPEAESYDVLEFKDGRVFERYSRPQRTGEKSVGRVWSFRDVTVRKQAEEDLRFRSALLDAATDSVFVLNQQGKIIYVNEAACRDRGFTREELIGKPIDEVDAPQYKDAVRRNMQHLLETGSIRVETQHLKKDGTLMDVEVNARVIEFAGDKVIVGILRDIGERKRTEEALRFVAEGTASATGDEFFSSVARHLALALRVRFALVAERIEPFRGKVRTLAVWAGDNFSDNVEYDVAGSPCEKVLKEEICFHPQHVQELFPQHTMLVGMGVESYLGVALFDSAGRVIGHLAVMDDQPMTGEASARSIMKIFAARAGTELERRQKEEDVRHMAYHDPLTDLPNRTLLADRLQQALIAGQRENESVALLFVDLNRFKEVNDAFGHQEGDQLLKQVSSRIRGTLRESDTVARVGGDEFAVVLPKTDAAGAELATGKILEALESSFGVLDQRVNIGASIGIVMCTDPGRSLDLFLQEADRAMYRAKQTGQGWAIGAVAS